MNCGELTLDLLLLLHTPRAFAAYQCRCVVQCIQFVMQADHQTVQIAERRDVVTTGPKHHAHGFVEPGQDLVQEGRVHRGGQREQVLSLRIAACSAGQRGTTAEPG